MRYGVVHHPYIMSVTSLVRDKLASIVADEDAVVKRPQ
jgi:hypothetical protein